MTLKQFSKCFWYQWNSEKQCGMCSTYKKKGKDVCSGHYIREQELSAILLDDIRRITHFARQNELRFAEHIQKKQSKETQREIAALQKKIDDMRKRQTELTKLFKRLYEKMYVVKGKDNTLPNTT